MTNGSTIDQAKRITELMRLFAAYGTVPDETRLNAYLDVIEPVPTGMLRAAIDAAMAESRDYPPGPGHVEQAWRKTAERVVYTPHGYHKALDGLERHAVKALPAPGEVALGDGATWRLQLFDKARELRQADPARVEREGRGWSYTAATEALGGDPKTWLPRRRA